LQEKRLKQRARGYAVVNGELYKLGVTEPWLRCITSKKGLELLREIHSGFCGTHIGTRALAGKAIKQGFYWPTIKEMRKHWFGSVKHARKRRISKIYLPYQFT
jgi:hypothetical protein